MSYSIDALSSLTKLTPTTPPDADSISVHEADFNSLVSNAFTKISETSTQYKDVINSLSNSASATSDPKSLLMLQGYLGEYSNYISLVSTLARKGVATIETLEKSQ